MIYTKWKPKLICHRTTTGSRWFYGNFSIGIMVDSHPRFFDVVLGLGFFEVGIGFNRDAVLEEKDFAGRVT